jgi:hypothetical protein
VPGVYRIAVIITEKGSTPKKLHREVRLPQGLIVAVAFDGQHKTYKP